MRVFSLLVDDAVSLLGHEQADGDGEVVVDEAVLEPLAAALGVLDLGEGAGLLAEQVSARHRIDLK